MYNVQFQDKKDPLYIGSAEIEVNELITRKNSSLSKAIVDKQKQKHRKNGTITIRYQEYDVSDLKYEFHLGVQDFNCKNEMFIQFNYFIDRD